MTKLRDLNGFEECVPSHYSQSELHDVNVVVDEEKLSKIIYTQIASIAMGFNFPNGWSKEKQKVVEIHTDDFTKAIVTKLKQFIRLEKSDDK